MFLQKTFSIVGLLALSVLLIGCSSFVAKGERPQEQEGGLSVTGLRTLDRIKPLGIDTVPPTLSWRLEAGPRTGVRQSAYQVQAAAGLQELVAGRSLLWDSGRIEGDRAAQIAYDGFGLESRQRIWWRVRVWDNVGVASDWSEPTWFETGLLDEADWQQAAWIGCTRAYDEPHQPPEELMGDWITSAGDVPWTGLVAEIELPDKPVVLARGWWGVEGQAGNVRRSLVANPERARLYVSPLGSGRPFINGEAAGDRLLSPAQSDYEDFAFYNTYDVTGLLEAGENALAVLLDGSWYHQVGGFNHVMSYGRPGLRSALVLEYDDGRTDWVLSDRDWEWKEGELREANIYRGERVDYRQGHDEWRTPGAGVGWQAVQTLGPRSPVLRAEQVEPVRVTGEIAPVKLARIGEKTWLFDVGEMIHGGVRLRLNEPAGTRVRLRYSEFARDGRLMNVPTSHWWAQGEIQSDEIVADGRERVFQTRFSPKSFRYVEVSGLSSVPEEDDLQVLLIHTDAKPLATFESSDGMLNRLFANGIRTFRNYMSRPPAQLFQNRPVIGLIGEIDELGRVFFEVVKELVIVVEIVGVYVPLRADAPPSFGCRDSRWFVSLK